MLLDGPDHNAWLQSRYGDFVIDAKVSWTVHHDRVEVERGVVRIKTILRRDVELDMITFRHVIPMYGDILFSVAPVLFMCCTFKMVGRRRLKLRGLFLPGCPPSVI
jgi:hypothetical protein